MVKISLDELIELNWDKIKERFVRTNDQKEVDVSPYGRPRLVSSEIKGITIKFEDVGRFDSYCIGAVHKYEKDLYPVQLYKIQGKKK